MRDSLTDGSSGPASPCPGSGFACSNNQCIRVSQVCDFTPHCLLGEDEASCRKMHV